MKIINSIQTNIYEGTTNEKEVVDRLNTVTDTTLTAHTEVALLVAASQTDQAISLTGLTPTKYVMVSSDTPIAVKFAAGGTSFTGSQFFIGGSVTAVLITTTLAANVSVIICK